MKAMDKSYDLIIIGSGPAGLSASIYASRYGIKHAIIGQILGGQISEAHLIDNYPGIENLTGAELGKKLGEHAKKYGAEIIPGLVKNIKKEEEGRFIAELENNEALKTKTVLLATGMKRRKLDILGEKEFAGKGVSYCATCDGFFYKNKTVGVIGGSNSAAGAALYLADICKKVYIIYRKSELRCEPFWADSIKKNEKIEVIYNTNVVKISGQEKLERVELDNPHKNSSLLEISGLFIEAGSDPYINYADDLDIKSDKDGYIKIKSDGSTSVPGIFAAGDITDGSNKFRQVITAAAEGAIAVRSVFNWLKK